ncbi:MAG: Uma2 family endonuclease [Microcystaceae cyanobacterium]
METLQQTTEIPLLPTEIWSDEPPVESDLHLQQITLLLACLDWLWSERTDYYASGNLTIYYNQEQLKNKDFCGPDFFVVLNTEKRPRKSWVVWGEGGNYPNLIIEILSDSTAKVDRTKKKTLYQNTFRTPEYFWFDPNSLEFQGFVLIGGNYEAIKPNQEGYLESQQLGLYLGIYENKLRYFTLEGELVPTPKEAAIQERLDKEREKLMRQQIQEELESEQLAKQQIQEELELEKQRTAQLEQRLRELGINLDD